MKTNALKSALILATTLSLTACNGISALQKSIDQLGYIYNGVPLATGGWRIALFRIHPIA